MQWETILENIRQLEIQFNKSYKCISQNRDIREETLNKHLTNLIENYNAIRATLYQHYNLYTTSHKQQANAAAERQINKNLS